MSNIIFFYFVDENVLPPMSLSTYLLGNTDLETIDDLRALLKSDELYKNNVVFDLLCRGLESGSFKGVPKKQRSPLVDLITVAHEASFITLLANSVLGTKTTRRGNLNVVNISSIL